MPGISVRRIRDGKKEKPIQLSGIKFLIGRSSECDIRVSSDASSRKHAVVRLEGDTWFAEDLGSSNGTFLNGKLIQSSALRPSDVLKLGEAGARLQIVGLDPAPAHDAAGEEKTRYIRVDKGGRQRQTAAPAIMEPMHDAAPPPAARAAAPPPAQASAPAPAAKSGKMGKWRWFLPLLGIAFGALCNWRVWSEVTSGFPYQECWGPLRWAAQGLGELDMGFFVRNLKLVVAGLWIVYYLIWGLLLMRPWRMRFTIIALLIAHGVAIGTLDS